MKTTLIVVCGSRTFHKKEYMREKLQEIKNKHGNLIIREGGAVGADFLARMLCYEEIWLKHEKSNFKPKYGIYSRGAPLMRNIQMLDTKPTPKLVVGFHDGRLKDSGTSHTINNAKKRNIKIYEFFGD